MSANEIVAVEGLSAKFDDRPVLDEVSFAAYENQITVILGSSGSGKTTLLKHLIGLYPVQHGSVTILGQRLSKLEEKQRHTFFLKIGVLYQNGALLNSLTVAENIALPLEQHTQLPAALIEELVRLKLHLVNLDDAYGLYPAQLSGGMRKRAALARAIAMDPPVLFCDEPGAGLDPVLLASLDDLIRKLKEQLGMTIILVTHEISSIHRLADRIVFLSDGKVVFAGPLGEAQAAGIGEIDDFFRKAKGRQ